MPRSGEVAAENEEATEAWSGVLFDRFVEYRDLIVEGLKAHGDAAMQLYPPEPGDRVIDIGCGFGDTTQQFFAADVQVGDLQGPYDYAFSRMGLMFVANPVQALRNIRGSLRPGGRLVGAVWRRKLDNEWLHRAEQATEQYLEEPEEPEDVRCGPGPFSMANPDTVSEQLQIAGFERPTFTRCDIPIKIGNDLDHAVAFNMALGPAAELLRICPTEEVDRLRPKVERDIRNVLADYVEDDGLVLGPASTWIVTATVPE